MKYDSDLIDTMYLLKQHDSALAERMWDRLTKTKVEVKSELVFEKTINVGFGLQLSEEVYQYMKHNHSDLHYNTFNKVAAIKALREKTSWGLKDAKDAVDYMLQKGMLNTSHY